MNLEKLGTIIHNKREEVGIPLAKAAQKAGIGRSTLWILEQGKNPKTGKPSRPSKDILERLAEVLHMSQAELEEILTFAGYQISTKLTQTPTNQVLAAMQTATTQEHTMSYEKRYNLLLSQEQFDQMNKAAKDSNLSFADFVRRSIKLGCVAAEIEKTPGDALIARRNGKDKKVRVFPRRYEDDDTLFLS